MDPPGSTNVGLPPIFQVFGKAISSAIPPHPHHPQLPPLILFYPRTNHMHANTVSPFAGISMLQAAKTTKKKRSGLTAPSAHLYQDGT